MEPERWQRVEQLCHSALECEEGQQAAFLEAACGGDKDLRREVESLLAHQTQAGQFMETPAMHVAAQSLAASSELSEGRDPLLGRRLGPYQIAERIGSGGMGEVYRAVRADEEYRQQVAIKLVRGGLDPTSVNLRFRNERQILATLDHPNIARLLDGGTTEEGIPYVVMELIQGERMDQYCDSCRLSLGDRIRLFIQVCDAVQYAHQRLIVHRDLKPGNILVTASGTPKLLDFGIAKILDAGTVAIPVEATLTVQRVLTPGYASPEQVKGGTITTASDVYSLGVVLYELLAGCSPYRDAGKTADEIARAVCEAVPEKPSTVVRRPRSNQKGAASPSLALEPGSTEEEKEELSKRLSGDLDNIVLMALRKEPERRYTSVEQFSEDLRRHLQNLPVIACRDTIGYRATKFVRRHKAGVAAAGAVFITLAAGIAVTLHEARVARQQADAAHTQRLRAERRFNDVRALANSLIFGVHDAIENLPGATPARKLLVSNALRYLDSLAQEASGDLSLQRELASAYEKLGDVQGDPSGTNLGDTAGALASYRKALAIRAAVASTDGNDLESQAALAADHKKVANSLMASGEYKQAMEHAQQAFIIEERLNRTKPGPEMEEGLAGSYYQIARCEVDLGDFKTALTDLQKSAAIRERIGAGGSGFSTRVQVRLAGTYGLIATAVAHQNDFDRAVAMYRKTAEIMAKLSTADPTNAMYREYLAEAYYFQGFYSESRGDMEEALKQYHHALPMFESLDAADPNEIRARRFIGICLKHVGTTLVSEGKISQGTESARKGLAIAEDLYRMDPSEKSDKLTDLADAYAAVGFAYWRAGVRSNLSRSARVERLKQASDAYQKSLDTWLEAKGRGTLAAVDSGGPELIARELAKCDADLARLTRTGPQKPGTAASQAGLYKR